MTRRVGRLGGAARPLAGSGKSSAALSIDADVVRRHCRAYLGPPVRLYERMRVDINPDRVGRLAGASDPLTLLQRGGEGAAAR